MAYKQITMDKIPPWCKKDLKWKYTDLNAQILKAFKETECIIEISKSPYGTNGKKVYLQKPNVDDVLKVEIVNKQGGDITYNTVLESSYQSYIILKRPLVDGEKLLVTIKYKPTDTDVLDDDTDHVYIVEEVYQTLIKNLKNIKE
jgi:hypothetical protein